MCVDLNFYGHVAMTDAGDCGPASGDNDMSEKDDASPARGTSTTAPRHGSARTRRWSSVSTRKPLARKLGRSVDRVIRSSRSSWDRTAGSPATRMTMATSWVSGCARTLQQSCDQQIQLIDSIENCAAAIRMHRSLRSRTLRLLPRLRRAHEDPARRADPHSRRTGPPRRRDRTRADRQAGAIDPLSSVLRNR